MTLAIGDLQGCFGCLQQLLQQAAIGNHPDAGVERLWLTGDLVNRGPQSLQTLRWARDNRLRLVTVLGNHDLHLLAVAAGIRPPGRTDTLDEILAAPDRDVLIAWLRQQPLAHFEHGFLLVHAGVLPQWSAERTIELAAEVQQRLRGPDWKLFLRELYGDRPAGWRDDLTGADRLRVIVNALTRLRFCTPAGDMEFATHTGPATAPPGYLPWFDLARRATGNVTTIFGHWSSLGLFERDNLLGLDTGCVWGEQLTAVRLEDRARHQVACPKAASSGAG